MDWKQLACWLIFGPLLLICLIATAFDVARLRRHDRQHKREERR